MYKGNLEVRNLKSSSSNQELKRLVGQAAADLVEDGMTIGVGTGSTVAFFIEKLGERVRHGLKVKAVPTSYQSKIACHQMQIPLMEAGMIDRLDMAIDGADEIDHDLNAIKGGGAAHTNEKIIASMADSFILIADQSKLVHHLGMQFPIPVEIIPNALGFVIQRIKALGGDPKIRIAVKKDGPVVTDNGNFIADIYFTKAPDIHKLNIELKMIPGVVDHGLFIGIAKKALIAGEKGILTLTAPAL